jgi:hypothetical protein
MFNFAFALRLAPSPTALKKVFLCRTRVAEGLLSGGVINISPLRGLLDGNADLTPNGLPWVLAPKERHFHIKCHQGYAKRRRCDITGQYIDWRGRQPHNDGVPRKRVCLAPEERHFCRKCHNRYTELRRSEITD